VTNETTPDALQWLAATKFPEDFEALKAWTVAHAAEIDLHPGAFCAAELALLDLFARERGLSVEALLGVSEARTEFQYSAVVSDESGDALDALLGRYLGVGFKDFKFKLAGDDAADGAKLRRFAELSAEAGGPFRVRLDGNNVYGDDARRALASLKRLGPVFAIEEPMRAGRADDLSALSTGLGVPIILDECLCRPGDAARYAALPGKWIANVKVSKSGGLQRSIAIIGEAAKAGWPVLIGAQVGETSVLTRAGLVAARAAGDALLALEGGFGTLLLAHDLTEPVLSFGFDGKLALPDFLPGGTPGLGLTRNTEDPWTS
jgi:L-alanine-DL-glutamate epimerase-like enolase superfamily enzyme